MQGAEGTLSEISKEFADYRMLHEKCSVSQKKEKNAKASISRPQLYLAKVVSS